MVCTQTFLLTSTDPGYILSQAIPMTQTTDLEWISALGLSESERDTLSVMLTPGVEVEAITDGMEARQIWDAIMCSVKVYGLAKRAQQQLKPIIGRLLIALRSYPELYQSRGYISFDDFVSRGCPELFSMPRSEAYRAQRLVEAWPNLSPVEFSEIGEGKLYTLSSFTNSRDPASAGWLEIARSSTLDQLKDRIVQSGEGTAAGLIACQISLSTNLEIKQAWSAFISNPAVQSTVGSDDPGQILSAILLEAASSWGI